MHVRSRIRLADPAETNLTVVDLEVADTFLEEGDMSRGDGLHEELNFSDRDDDTEEYGGYGSSYDDDEEDEESWGPLSERSAGLWDSPEEIADDEEEEREVTSDLDEEEDDVGLILDEEDTDEMPVVSRTPAPSPPPPAAAPRARRDT
jgi:hypothetical protein